MRRLKRIEGHPARFGGECHSGWLPEGAATPQPTAAESVALDLTISSDGHGYLLEWRDANGIYQGDTWHQTLEDALEQARYSFGIAPLDWNDFD